MSIDHIISGICNLRIGEVILIGDNTILLNYRHLFMGSLRSGWCLVVIYIGY